MTKIYARVKRQRPSPVYVLSCLWYLHLSTSFMTKIYARDSGHCQSMYSLVCGINICQLPSWLKFTQETVAIASLCTLLSVVYTSVNFLHSRKRQWPLPVYALSCLWYLHLSTSFITKIYARDSGHCHSMYSLVCGIYICQLPSFTQEAVAIASLCTLWSVVFTSVNFLHD
jgi:hypothetical protein